MSDVTAKDRPNDAEQTGPRHRHELCVLSSRVGMHALG